MKIQTKTL